MENENIKIAVIGASGRIGRELVATVIGDDSFTLSGATVRTGHDWVGRDVGACLGLADSGVIVQEDVVELFSRTDAVIDFTNPESSVLHAELAAQAKCVLVIGTTGFNAEQLNKIAIASRHARVIRSENMSFGVNLLAKLTKMMATILDDTWDIEILETHHRGKVDAPSGTALMLGEVAAKGRGVLLGDVSERGRDGISAARATGAIGFSSVRAGDVVCEHDVVFARQGERLVFRHIATDRSIFVRGALNAAVWGLKQHNGEYNIEDVLGIKNSVIEGLELKKIAS